MRLTEGQCFEQSIARAPHQFLSQRKSLGTSLAFLTRAALKGLADFESSLVSNRFPLCGGDCHGSDNYCQLYLLEHSAWSTSYDDGAGDAVSYCPGGWDRSWPRGGNKEFATPFGQQNFQIKRRRSRVEVVSGDRGRRRRGTCGLRRLSGRHRSYIYGPLDRYQLGAALGSGGSPFDRTGHGLPSGDFCFAICRQIKS